MSELLIERRGDVVLLTLSNPEKRNALDPRLCSKLTSAVANLALTGARAAVLTGVGDKAFSAGYDLEALAASAAAGPGGDDGAGSRADNRFEKLIDAVAATPVPLVAALNGPAIGGGFELAATCDLRVGHPGIKLAMPPARLGIIYSPRGLARFAALVGESRARELFLTAKALSGAEAHSWGLCDHLVEPGQVVSRALALAEAMAELAPLAVQGMRRSFELLLRHRVALPAEQLEEVERARHLAFFSEDALEARRAFAEKRKPVFRGR